MVLLRQLSHAVKAGSLHCGHQRQDGGPGHWQTSKHWRRTNRSYHIPGEVVVFETLSKDPEDVNDGENIPIHDYGTLAGDKLSHHSDSDKLVEVFWKFKSIKIKSQILFF